LEKKVSLFKILRPPVSNIRYSDFFDICCNVKKVARI